MATIRKTLGNETVSSNEVQSLRALKDEDIDFSDIPELTDEDLRNGVWKIPLTKVTDRLEVYKDSQNKWRWRRVAPNGRIVGASSQGYSGKQAALENAQRIATPFKTVDVA